MSKTMREFITNVEVRQLVKFWERVVPVTRGEMNRNDINGEYHPVGKLVEMGFIPNKKNKFEHMPVERRHGRPRPASHVTSGFYVLFLFNRVKHELQYLADEEARKDADDKIYTVASREPLYFHRWNVESEGRPEYGRVIVIEMPTAGSNKFMKQQAERLM